MEPISRRNFIGLLGAAGVVGSGLALGACGTDDDPPVADPSSTGKSTSTNAEAAGESAADGYVFPEGVIAGDPGPAGAVIWTRVAAPAGASSIGWQVATDKEFADTRIEGAAKLPSGPDAGGTAFRTRVHELDPDSWWYYRFRVLGDDGAVLATSRVGRLRTAPAQGTDPAKPLRFAFASCQQLSGEYAAHAQLARRDDIDFLVHLGDYVYVSDTDTITLDDYLGVYRRFKAQPHLQDLQAQVPLVAMWDDGEFYNGVDGHGEPERLAAARAAWFENMPVMKAEGASDDRIYRTVAWGALADLFMIDVRRYRDPAVEPYDTNDPAALEMFNPKRTTLGAPQKQWLKDGLRASAEAKVPWRLIGNPYDLAMWRLIDTDTAWPRPPGAIANSGVYAPNEAWDDYAAERRELLQYVADQHIPNVISCSGHTHIWIASDLRPDPDDPNSPVVGFDFTCGSQTADPDMLADVTGEERKGKVAGFREAERRSIAVNPWMTYGNLVDQGYAVVEVSRWTTTVEFWFVDPHDASADARLGARFTVESGATTMTMEEFDEARRV